MSGSNQINIDTQAASPNKIIIDLQKDTEISGFYISSGIKNFHLAFKKDGFKEFIDFRSPDTDEILQFNVENEKVFLPDRQFVIARWFKLKEVQLSNTANFVQLDILGCCSTCGPPPTTILTTMAPSTTPPGQFKASHK